MTKSRGPPSGTTHQQRTVFFAEPFSPSHPPKPRRIHELRNHTPGPLPSHTPPHGRHMAATKITQHRIGHTLVTSAHLRGISAGDIIALLHDPARLFALPPYITAYEPLPAPPNSYKLTIRIPVIFGWHINGTAIARLTPTDTGVVAEVEAGTRTWLRSVTRSTWTVEEETEGCNVSEVFGVVHATPGCAWFVLMTAQVSHRRLVERFVEAVIRSRTVASNAGYA
jgi:hypothetical protein